MRLLVCLYVHPASRVVANVFTYPNHTGIVLPFEPAHEKTYNKTCVINEDSEQPLHPPSMARVLNHYSLDSPEFLEGTRDQRTL